MTALKTEFASLRTGRASASIVEPIQVDAYGQMTPINQLGTVNVPEPRMVVINVWDKGMISKVERAIRDSGIGINPIVDGPLIRLPIPELNEERRERTDQGGRAICRTAPRSRSATCAATGWTRSRRPRPQACREDDQKMWSDEVQELTDKAIAAVDRALEAKQAEIMQV